MLSVGFVIALVVIGFFLCFLVSVGIGANDVGNSFGSVYGNRSLRFRYIIILAVVCELLGGILVGIKVTNTIRKGIVSLDDLQLAYSNKSDCKRPFNQNSPTQVEVLMKGNNLGCPELIHMIGNVAVLFACVISLFFANLFKLPASATHVVVGATLGYGLVALEGRYIKWTKMLEIVASWVISPVISGLFAAGVCYLMDQLIVIRSRPSRSLVIVIAFLYLTVFVLLFSLFFNGSSLLKFDQIPFWGVLLIAGFGSLAVSLLVRFLLVPRLQPVIQNAEVNNIAGETIFNSSIDKTANLDQSNVQNEGGIVIATLLRWLQILTACSKSFAHGGNDVSNSVAPLMSIWLIYSLGSMASTADSNVYLLVFGSLGIAIGVIGWGKRVMKTIGREITTITPISGFSIEFSSSTTVLAMTLLGLPVSTTHCTVGSTVSVGWLRQGIKSVNRRLLLSILICWVVSVPVPAFISGAIFAATRAVIFGAI